MLRLKWLLTSALLAHAVAVSPVLAKVASTTLEELFWQSDLVAVGRDVRTFQVDGWTVAEFETIRFLRGASDSRSIFYLAEPTWAEPPPPTPGPTRGPLPPEKLRP
jgi:hypothetical protein